MTALDRTVLASLESDLGDRQVVREVVRTYLDLLPERQDAVAGAAAAGDRVRLQREAHKLGSSSAVVGAVELRELCRRLEASDPAGGGVELGGWAELWASHCARTTEALTAWLAGS